MRSEFERALDDCLEAIRRGATNLDALVGRYPRHAERLRPLVEAASRVSAPVPPAREKKRGMARLQAALVVERERTAVGARRIQAHVWATSGGLLAVAGLLVLLLAAVSSAAAASGRVRDVLVPAPVQDFFSPRKNASQFEGVISEVGERSMVVRSQQDQRRVRFAGDMQIVDAQGTPAPEATLTPGLRVHVAGTLNSDQTLNAERVQLQPADDEPPPPPPATTPPGRAVHFTGKVQSLAAGSMVVESGNQGWQVWLDDSTEVEGTLAPGAHVQVEGRERPDGGVAADRVRMIGSKDDDGGTPAAVPESNVPFRQGQTPDAATPSPDKLNDE